MEPDEQNTSPTSSHRAHTYADDLARAMNATDAAVVQELLATAREKEATERAYKKQLRQKKWYGFFSFFFIILAAAAMGYTVYHYNSLTVPVEPAPSVGVFPNTAPIVVRNTTIAAVIAQLQTTTDLDTQKPYLVPLVNDEQSLLPISKNDFFNFIEADATEPLIASMDIIRLGVLNKEGEVIPFLILSVRDPQIASKEFLIAEPELLELFGKALGITKEEQEKEIGRTFILAANSSELIVKTSTLSSYNLQAEVWG